MIHCAMREVITLVFVHDILVIYIQALRISELSLIFSFVFLGHFAAHFVVFFESALHADCYKR